MPAPHSDVVTDLAAFEECIALAPKPEQFREGYPEVAPILPADIVTRALRRCGESP